MCRDYNLSAHEPVLNLRLPQRLRDPFTALLLFGAAGILAMIVAFIITSLPRLGAPAPPATSSAQQQVSAPPAEDMSSVPPSPAPPRGHGHKK